jgi:hypothetical protein
VKNLVFLHLRFFHNLLVCKQKAAGTPFNCLSIKPRIETPNPEDEALLSVELLIVYPSNQGLKLLPSG